MLGGIGLRGRPRRLGLRCRLRERLEIAPRLGGPRSLGLEGHERAGGAGKDQAIGLMVDDQMLEGPEAVHLSRFAGGQVDRGKMARAVSDPDPLPHHGENLARAAVGPEEVAGLGRVAAEPLFTERNHDPVPDDKRPVLLRSAVEEHAPGEAQFGPPVERIDAGEVTVDGGGENRGAAGGNRSGLRAVEEELLPLPVAVPLLHRDDRAVAGRPHHPRAEWHHRPFDDPTAIERERLEVFRGVHPGPFFG